MEDGTEVVDGTIILRISDKYLVMWDDDSGLVECGESFKEGDMVKIYLKRDIYDNLTPCQIWKEKVYDKEDDR